MEHSELIQTEIKDNVQYIILNRPDKLNALIEPMRQDLVTTIESLSIQQDISVCIITGSGRGFCAGGDIQYMEGLIEKSDFDEVQTFLELGKKIIITIRSLPIPVIAAVNGPAAGAGMNLALACDLRLASTRATFGETFINIGLHPDWGGTYLLPKIVGPSRSLEIFWTGRIIEANEALQLGIVNMVIPHEDFSTKVHEFAKNLASRSGKVISLSKKGVYGFFKEDLQNLLRHEEMAQAECIRSESARTEMCRFLNERMQRKANNKGNYSQYKRK